MKHDRRSACPLSCSLDIVGDKWTLLVVRDLLCGMERYDQLRSSPEGIATNILADRLSRLEEQGILVRRPTPEHRGRFTYHLTQSGQRLGYVVLAMIEWGLKSLPGTRLQPGAAGLIETARLRRLRRRSGDRRGAVAANRARSSR